MHAGILQVTMGITTLLLYVPVPLAAAHQAGSVLLLTTMLGLLGALRRPSSVARIWAEAGKTVRAARPTGQAMKDVQSGMKARVNIP